MKSDGDEWPWHPISTAPKDGSDILVGCGSVNAPMYAVVHWDDGKIYRPGEPGWLLWWACPAKYADWAEYWQPIAPCPNAGREET